ncbi:hypothetical protein MRX96_027846 [Rhipicephalus microplus]
MCRSKSASNRRRSFPVRYPFSPKVATLSPGRRALGSASSGGGERCGTVASSSGWARGAFRTGGNEALAMFAPPKAPPPRNPLRRRRHPVAGTPLSLLVEASTAA